MSKAVPTGKSGTKWQYHSRGDRHSKIACWGVIFDLLRHSKLLRAHVGSGQVGLGINHEMQDFKQGRKKKLDLVLCGPGSGKHPVRAKTFASLVDDYSIVLDDQERKELEKLPMLTRTDVGQVYAALEAKACMTEHLKARPRLYDELNSSHLTVHGASATAIAIGFVMVNLADEFQSPGLPTPSRHDQPRVTARVIEKIKELPRRSSTAESGFDAIGIVVVRCANNGTSPVELIEEPPAPSTGDTFEYAQMIRRITYLYESRFPQV